MSDSIDENERYHAGAEAYLYLLEHQPDVAQYIIDQLAGGPPIRYLAVQRELGIPAFDQGVIAAMRDRYNPDQHYPRYPQGDEGTNE